MEHLAPLQTRLSSVIVTTPQAVALTDAIKGISFTRVVSLPMLGLIENMSGYVWYDSYPSGNFNPFSVDIPISL